MTWNPANPFITDIESQLRKKPGNAHVLIFGLQNYVETVMVFSLPSDD